MKRGASPAILACFTKPEWHSRRAVARKFRFVEYDIRNLACSEPKDCGMQTDAHGLCVRDTIQQIFPLHHGAADDKQEGTRTGTSSIGNFCHWYAAQNEVLETAITLCGRDAG